MYIYQSLNFNLNYYHLMAHNSQNRSSQHSTWQIFINQLSSSSPKMTPTFPKPQILNFLQQKQPTMKQLLQLLPSRYLLYKQNPSKLFQEIIIMLYIIIVKGCNNQKIYEIIEEFIVDLLKYRILVVIAVNNQSHILEAYYYLSQLLQLVIPQLLRLENFIAKIFKKITSNSLIFNSYQTKAMNSEKDQKEPVNQIIIVFHGLFICKISSHLTKNCNLEFKSFLENIYPLHYFNILSDSLFIDLQSGTTPQSVVIRCPQVQIDGLFFFRQSDNTSFFQNLNFTQQADNKMYIERGNCVPPSKQQDWVHSAYQQEPQSVCNRLGSIPKMTAFQLYKFLSLLEIYGSSPKIQVLNDYLVTPQDGNKLQGQEVTQEEADQFLQFFSKFLMGEQITQAYYKYGNYKWEAILKQCRNKAEQYQLSNSDMMILVNELINVNLKQKNRQ